MKTGRLHLSMNRRIFFSDVMKTQHEGKRLYTCIYVDRKQSGIVSPLGNLGAFVKETPLETLIFEFSSI